MSVIEIALRFTELNRLKNIVFPLSDSVRFLQRIYLFTIELVSVAISSGLNRISTGLYVHIINIFVVSRAFIHVAVVASQTEEIDSSVHKISRDHGRLP